MNKKDEQIIKEFQKLPNNFWDFKENSTNDLTHGLHNYPATMIYPISQSIINILKRHIKIDTLFDPFVGSGTVLVEGMMAGIKNLYGTDLNPLAILLSEVKTTVLNKSQINYLKTEYLNYILSKKEQIKNTSTLFDQHIRNELHLDITEKENWGNNASTYINNYFVGNDYKYPLSSNLGFWFLPSVVIELSEIKKTILTNTDTKIRNFLLVAFSETVRIVSNTRNSEFKLYRIAKEKLEKYYPDVLFEYLRILKRNISKMEDFSNICPNESRTIIKHEDARNLNSIPDNSIDLIITSPPYGDSKTTVAYGQFSRLSLQWLDLDITNNNEIISIDNELLGGKKKKNTDWEELKSPSLLKALNKIKQADEKRASEVFDFYYDLDIVLRTLSIKTKTNGYQFWVVGNRTVKLVKLQTDIIISEMAKKYGLSTIYSFNRTISNKVMPSLNCPTNKVGNKVQTMTSEIIFVLKKEG